MNTEENITTGEDIELQNQGIEPERETEHNDISTPFDPKKVEISVETITIRGLVEMITHEEIDLMPEFQRQGNLWNSQKMSQLIESILIRLPLPAMYMDVADDQKWVVVDGLQRLSTIERFLVEKNLTLKGLEFLKELDGKKYEDLERVFQRRIMDTNITLFKIKKGTPKEVLTSLFHRINTGGTKLTAQEIRHALNQGQVTTFLKDITDSAWFKACIKVSPKRMLHKELIVRFSGFLYNGYRSYKPSLQLFLDKEMVRLNKKETTIESLRDLEKKFKDSLELSSFLFDDKPFSKAIYNENARNGVNRSLYECTTVNFALLNEAEKEQLRTNKEDFLNDYCKLLSTAEFDFAISANTHIEESVRIRHQKMQELITKYTGHAY